MFLLVKLAVRNLRRQLRRTVIAGSAVACGLFFLIVGTVVADGVHRNWVDNAVAILSGHIVVQHPAYQKENKVEHSVKGASEVTTKLEQMFPGRPVVTRIFVNGLLTSPQGSVGASIIAVDPQREAPVSKLDDKIVEGTWLTRDTADLVIGTSMAESLGVRLGDRVVFMLQRGSELESQLFRVRGVFKTGVDELDGFVAVVPLAAAQKMLGVTDEVTQVAVMLELDDDLDQLRDDTRARLARPDLAVLTWREAAPDLYEFIVLDDMGMWVFLLIIALVAAIGVLNTMLMSVLERTHELGVMLALGMKRTRLAALVLCEATLLGAGAAAVGTGLGLIFGQYLVVSGVDYGALMGDEALTVSGIPMDLVVNGYLDLGKVIFFFFLTVAVTVVSSLYPVWWTSRLQPVEAMARR